MKCFRPEEINKETDFIFFALLNRYDEVDELLGRKGFSEGRDYLYVFNNNLTITSCNGYYLDVYGNEIHGKVDGFKINFSGINNFVYIGDNCKIDKSVEIDVTNNSRMIIDNNVHIGKDAYLESSAHAIIKISRNCTFVMRLVLRSSQNSLCYMGEDCMSSNDVLIQSADSHDIYDLDKRENISKRKDYGIIINDHVWLGARSKILYGANIGSGSVVGMNSFVNKKFPNNVVIAGNPAEILRENVAWHRCRSFIDDYEEFKEFDFTNKSDKAILELS